MTGGGGRPEGETGRRGRPDGGGCRAEGEVGRRGRDGWRERTGGGGGRVEVKDGWGVGRGEGRVRGRTGGGRGRAEGETRVGSTNECTGSRRGLCNRGRVGRPGHGRRPGPSAAGCAGLCVSTCPGPGCGGWEPSTGRDGGPPTGSGTVTTLGGRPGETPA